MRKVIIESPYAGDVDRNLKYLREALRDALHRGEAPIASHGLYTQPGVLDDNGPDERARGIAAGHAWLSSADAVVFYIDRGWSPGMLAARELIENSYPETKIETRRIHDLDFLQVIADAAEVPAMDWKTGRVAEPAPRRWAAVSFIEAAGKMLCVWNRRYSGWSLPGGMVEDGETMEQAQARELMEETGLTTATREIVFQGPTGLGHEQQSRAGWATIYRVKVIGTPASKEEGCPIAWLTREEFLASSPFARFYRESVFPAVDAMPQ